MRTPRERKIRILLAKVGLDSHDRGALVVAYALRDAGMEVIYSGIHQRPEQIAQIALHEDVDIVGVSSLADAHNTLVPRVIKELRDRGKGDIPVVLGGFIQPEDIDSLKEQGVREVFGIGSSLDVIVSSFRGIAAERWASNKASGEN